MSERGATLKLVTRSQLGWPASAAPAQTSAKGVKVHYEGTEVNTRLLTDHDACIAEWKAIRKSHLANPTENYSDVAYNYAACPHGYLLEGRGIGRRTGANGNQELNRAHYAIVGLVGDEGLTEPTDAMLSAIRDGIDLLRKNGAGTEIRGHRDGYATACPGGPLYAWVQKGAPRPTTTEEDDMPTANEVAKAVLTYDGAIIIPGAPATNPTYTLASTQTEILKRIDRAAATIDKVAASDVAQTAAITALAKLVGSGADTATIVAAVRAEIRTQIETAVIKVDVAVTGQEN